MYSTSIKDNRYLVQCIAVSNKIRSAKFIVYTGAKFTCCTYKSIDFNMQEKNFASKETKYLGGFVKGSPVKLYKHNLIQFTIGSIDLEEQDIWITFDQRVTDFYSKSI